MKRVSSDLLRYFSIILLVSLTGCQRWIDWGKDVLHQTPSICYDEQIPHAYVRSLRLYDQLNTLAFFDALWLSDTVMDSYNAVHAERHGFHCHCSDEAFKHALIGEPGVVSFYLLAATPHTNNVPLHDCDPPWLLHLRLGDHVFSPACIKPVVFPPEIKAFYCLHYTRFKRQYCVRFELIDCDGHQVDLYDYRCMQLCFASPTHRDCMTWRWDSCGNIICHDDYPPEVLAYDL